MVVFPAPSSPTTSTRHSALPMNWARSLSNISSDYRKAAAPARAFAPKSHRQTSYPKANTD
eukprot:scaffold20882_cov71-Phaeocystis_antarctica.AAC.9